MKYFLNHKGGLVIEKNKKGEDISLLADFFSNIYYLV